jgi:hypothetical protein
MKKTTKEIGAKLELFVCSLLKDIFPRAKPTKGSGCTGQGGDIANTPGYKIECKVRNIPNAIIQRKWWNKLCGECIEYNRDIPVLILENRYQEKYAVLAIDDFVKILKK